MTIKYHDYVALTAYMTEPEYVRIASAEGAEAFGDSEEA